LNNNYLIVPVRIEAKYLESSCMAASPLADFTKLPWNDGTKDINTDNPFVADGIVHQPFESQNILLPAGVHLHFILPHYLGQQIPKNSKLPTAGKLPAAPNRWLITKSDNGTPTQQWVIESDYVHPENAQPDAPTCIIPFNQGQPYRYMGRTTPLKDGKVAGDTFKSLHNNTPLTVVGYGDMNFSSFYPNCMGVFGFCDKNEKASKNLTYSIVGWNADQEDDLLNQAIAKILANSASATSVQINAQLQNLFKLEISTDAALSLSAIPRTVFYGEIKVDGEKDTAKPKLNISIGNTGTEALSALLANEINPAKKQTIEDQLESILLFSKLDHLITDTGPKFLEARHEKGFRSSHSGYRWKIASQTPNQNGATTDANAPALPELPSELASLLHQLNLAQYAFDNDTHQIAGLREQLYLDWYKYMHAAYPPLEGRGQFPDPDRIRYFIENHSLPELSDKISKTGQITYGDADIGFQPMPTPAGADDLASKLSSSWIAANASLTAENGKRDASQSRLALSLVAGSRYWEPNPPVIMISGLDLDASDNNDENLAEERYLSCSLKSSSQNLDAASISTQNKEDILTQCSGSNSYSLSTQMWNPFILDWEIDLFDTRLEQSDGAFDEHGINKSFELDQFGPDFAIVDNYTEGNLSVFSGSVIMSSHARRAMLHNIKSFFTNALKQEKITFKDSIKIDDFLTATDWSSAFELLVPSDITKTLCTDDYPTNPLRTAWEAYHSLRGKKVISQALNGFNQACIMKKKVSQLPIDEPIGFEDGKNFTRNVKDYVQNNRDSSPITAFDFNPLRCGKITINRLSLIDNFGIAHDLDMEHTSPIAAETLRNDKGDVFLRPRLAQPARLNFRWLSALPVSAEENTYEDQSDSAETNDHPDTSPVCGWLMANYLDRTLAVFAADGSPLGYIDDHAHWNIPPWAKQTPNIDTNISNPYLSKIVSWLVNTFNESANNESANNWNYFLTATQTGLNNVAPASAHLYDSKALLMGRPMAVVRTRVSFELKGLPALEQSWPALLTDLDNCDTGGLWTHKSRYNKSWTKMRLPFRLGEHHQLNDGLVGYWTESKEGELSGKFEAPETTSDDVNDGAIDPFSGSNHQTQWLSLQDGPLNMTMLIDPRGLVHATSGLMPTKAISLSPQHYLAAMKKLGMWFYSSPLLQPIKQNSANIALDLPAIEGYDWQWWDRFYGTRKVDDDGSVKHEHSASELIEGWLKLVPKNTDKNN